jgi:hypothetical protein
MALSATRLSGAPQRFGRLWWLPPNGEGNGLDDVGWERHAPYLANLWRPASLPRDERSPEAAGLGGRKPAAEPEGA